MKGWDESHIEKLRIRGMVIAEKASIAVEKTLTQQERYQALGRMKGRKMNKTEIAYSHLLELQKQIGEVLWYEFEPMNLRIAGKCFYKVDFLVLTKEFQLEVHEVKGYWTDDALVKIKAAADKFPFRFLSKQLVRGKWEMREF